GSSLITQPQFTLLSVPLLVPLHGQGGNPMARRLRISIGGPAKTQLDIDRFLRNDILAGLQAITIFVAILSRSVSAGQFARIMQRVPRLPVFSGSPLWLPFCSCSALRPMRSRV